MAIMCAAGCSLRVMVVHLISPEVAEQYDEDSSLPFLAELFS
jgi:hypothetical protein